MLLKLIAAIRGDIKSDRKHKIIKTPIKGDFPRNRDSKTDIFQLFHNLFSPLFRAMITKLCITSYMVL